MAAAALPLEEVHLRIPRQDKGLSAALRVLVSARELTTVKRIAKVNALTALLRSVDLGLDAGRPHTEGKTCAQRVCQLRTLPTPSRPHPCAIHLREHHHDQPPHRLLSPEPVRVGLTGAGSMGAFHARSLALRIPRARLVAIADPTFEAAQALAG